MMYRQAAHYLDNLFSYFNRVHLNKFRPQDSLDYHVPGITLAPVLPVDPHAPVEIRHVIRKNYNCYYKNNACTYQPLY
jgi:cullin 2